MKLGKNSMILLGKKKKKKVNISKPVAGIQNN